MCTSRQAQASHHKELQGTLLLPPPLPFRAEAPLNYISTIFASLSEFILINVAPLLINVGETERPV